MHFPLQIRVLQFPTEIKTDSSKSLFNGEDHTRERNNSKIDSGFTKPSYEAESVRSLAVINPCFDILPKDPDFIGNLVN